MRKLLLATVATLGMSWGVADAATLSASAATTPEPGSIVVRLNGRLNFYMGVAGDSGQSYNYGKNNNFGTLGYMRLYPGFDGIAANGLKYGASIEIRQNFASPVSNSSSGNSTQSTLFVRRAYGYFGTDQVGTFRFGQTDGPGTLFLLGTSEGFNDGGWNGDLPGLVTGNTAPLWAWSDVGNVYTSSKIVYLSPSFYGFDFGVSFSPNTGNLQDNNGGCGTAAGNCATASALPGGLTDSTARRTNMVEAAVRYRGTFSGLGVAASAAYYGSGVTSNTTGPNLYNGISAGDVGLELSYAGFTVSGNVTFGQMNGSPALLMPKNADNTIAWIAGAQYTTGPLVVGASYFNNKYAGLYAPSLGVGQRTDQGIAAGATYNLVPGVKLFASYLYGMRWQGNYNFLAGTVGKDHNYVQSQAFSLGTQLTW